MPPTIKEYFKQFLYGYISAGHTVDDEAEKEAKHLTTEYVYDVLDDEDCFKYPVLCDYVSYMYDRLNDDYIELFTLYCNERRYSHLLEKYIQHLFD